MMGQVIPLRPTQEEKLVSLAKQYFYPNRLHNMECYEEDCGHVCEYLEAVEVQIVKLLDEMERDGH